MVDDGKPIRVAVLGGGVSGLAAAYELAHPRHNGRYEVTVYQMGWRLGGKCASGRNPNAGMRVQEHGPHAFFGYYDNAFQMLRECYGALGRKLLPTDPLPGRPALAPQDVIYAIEHLDAAQQPVDETRQPQPGDSWVPWRIKMPVIPGEPGTGDPYDLVTMLKRVWGFVHEAMRAFKDAMSGLWQKPRVAAALAGNGAAVLGLAARSTDQPLPDVLRRHIDAVHSRLERQHQGITEAIKSLPLGTAPGDPALARLTEALCGFADEWDKLRVTIDWLAALRELSLDLRHVFVPADLVVATLAGAFADNLLLGTTRTQLQAANRLDFREWLASHGAAAVTRESAALRSLYDVAFAYVRGHNDGDSAAPSGEAGQVVRGGAQMLNYRGHFYYKMQAGTGDVIVAPLYEYLRRERGVKFRFFHRVDAVVPTADGRDIDSIHIQRQVRLKEPDDTFCPLVPVGSLMCWPDRPPCDRIEYGESLCVHAEKDCTPRIDFEDPTAEWEHQGDPLVLRVGQDVDKVVLAISIAALPSICAPIIAQRTDWQAMIANVQTVATHSAQLWFAAPDGLGWRGDPHALADVQAGAGVADTVVCGLNYRGQDGAFDTWFDASDVLPAEDWGTGPRPTAMALLCGTLPEECDTSPEKAREASRAALEGLLSQANALWPALYQQGTFDSSKLFLAPGLGAVAPLDAQFTNTATHPSDRYVLGAAATGRFRLAPDASGFPSLLLAGDWTDYGLNLGCFEGAVISGRLAANAITPEAPRPILRDLRPAPG